MLEYVKNVIADKETTCKPERNLPTIFLFNTVRYGDSDDFSTQQQFISFPVWDWLELVRYNKNPASYLRAILFAYFFFKTSKELIRMPEDSALLRVSPRPYLQRYHRQASDVIISFCSKSCLHKSLRSIWYSDLPITFLTATYECFYFGSSSFYFFEINGV